MKLESKQQASTSLEEEHFEERSFLNEEDYAKRSFIGERSNVEESTLGRRLFFGGEALCVANYFMCWEGFFFEGWAVEATIVGNIQRMEWYQKQGPN